MERFDLGTLMAYADGELDADTARRVELVVAESVEAREAVAAFRETACLVRGAFNGPISESVPERLVAAVSGHPSRGSGRWVGWAMAASLAAVTIGAGGFGLGVHWGNDATVPLLETADLRIRGELLQYALEKTLSGTDREWRNPDTGHFGTIAPVRTYQQTDGTYCREYRETTVAKGTTDSRFGYACRDAGGTWVTRFEIVPRNDNERTFGS